MNFIKLAIFFAAVLVLFSVIAEKMLPMAGPVSYDVQNVKTDPYKFGNKGETINVTVEDIINAGESMRFDYAGLNESVVLIPGNQPFQKALFTALSMCPSEITMEQHCHASDLVGFLDLKNGTFVGSEKYGILSPYQGFWLNISISDPPEIRTEYPPSADVSGRIYTPGILSKTKLTVSENKVITNVSRVPAQECESWGDWWECWDGEKVIVEVLHRYIYSTGHVFKGKSYQTGIFFPHHDGCRVKSSGSVVVEHCKTPDGYIARAWLEDQDPNFAIRGFLTKAELSYQGYHGNGTKLVAECYVLVKMHYYEEDEEWYYLSGTVEIPLQKGNDTLWKGTTFIPIFRCPDCYTYVSCNLYLEDSVKAGSLTIDRKCPAGSFWYYYRPPYCPPGGTCVLDPDEGSEFSGSTAPEHAKKQYSCQSDAAEWFTLRALAEAVKAKTDNKVRRVLEEAAKDGSWKKYFNDLTENQARQLLQYFYLSQIPLNIKRNDSIEYSWFEAIIKKEANKSVIYSLTPLLENTSPMYTSETLCAPKRNWGSPTNCTASFILLDAQAFGNTLYDSPCGRFFVAELVEIRKPSIAKAEKYIKIPEGKCFAKGYSPSPGVVYPREQECTE